MVVPVVVGAIFGESWGCWGFCGGVRQGSGGRLGSCGWGGGVFVGWVKEGEEHWYGRQGSWASVRLPLVFSSSA